jgi:hypothetical protein
MTKYADEEGMYKDVPRNRIIAYWKVGERTPRVFLEGMEKGKKGKGAAAASQAAKMATQIPVAPIAPQASQAAPPPLPPQVAPSALGSAMPPPGAQTVRMSPPCSICGTVVPMSEFGAHVAACAAAQG